MEIALKLAEKSKFHDSDDYVVPTIPERNGANVTRIIRDGIKTAYDDGYKYIAKSFKRIKKSSVAIALPFSRQIFPAQKQLVKLGLNVDRAKGASLGRMQNGIVVTTYHQLKGLEFDYVVLMGMDDHNMPGRYIDRVPEEDIEEEEKVLCRLVYMAMTRAKKSLTVVGGKPFCRFFDEVPDILFEDK